MKIAIPSNEGKYLSQHFGRSLGFAIVELDGNRIINKEYRPNDFTGHAMGLHQQHQHHGEDHESHAQHSHNGILRALHDCEIVIAGGMGRRLSDDLSAAGKKIYITSEPEIDKVLEMFLDDNLTSDKEACGHHH